MVARSQRPQVRINGIRTRSPELAHLSPSERAAAGRRRGGQTRASAFTTEHQANAAKQLTMEQRRAAGAAGARATRARYGDDFLARKRAEWRKDHPTMPEQAFHRLLIAGLDLRLVDDTTDAGPECWEREVPAAGCHVDVGHRKYRWGVEVRGGVHDVWDTPEHEAERLAIIEAEGWRVLVIREIDLVNSKGHARYAFGLPALVEGFIRDSVDRYYDPEFSTWRQP